MNFGLYMVRITSWSTARAQGDGEGVCGWWLAVAGRKAGGRVETGRLAGWWGEGIALEQGREEPHPRRVCACG